MLARTEKLRDLIQSKHSQRKWSKAVRERDEYQCCLEIRRVKGWKKCGSRDKVEAAHIFPRWESGTAAFQIVNGITVCLKHHKILDNNTLGPQTDILRVPPARYEAAFRAVSFACTYPPKRRQ